MTYLYSANKQKDPTKITSLNSDSIQPISICSSDYEFRHLRTLKALHFSKYTRWKRVDFCSVNGTDLLAFQLFICYK